MDTDLKKMRKITQFMQKQGVLSLKTSEIEIHLAPAALFPEPVSHIEIPEEPPKPQYDDMDALLWSAPGLELPQ